MNILLFFSDGKLFDFIFCTVTYCVGAGICTLISISDGLSPYIFRRKMEYTRPMREEMEGKACNSHHSRHFSLIVNKIEVFFPICTLT